MFIAQIAVQSFLLTQQMNQIIRKFSSFESYIMYIGNVVRKL